MRTSARSFFVVHFLKIFLSIVLLFGVALAGAETAVAQTEPPQQQTQFTPAVPVRSSGIDVQVVMAESLAWLYCQVTGQSPHPSLPCLSIDPVTQQLGYAAPNTDEKLQVGGLLGTMSGMIATLYTPAVSSNDYMRYVASNFGIVKPAFAQPNPQQGGCNYRQFGTGYCSLTPILELWKITRNIAYFMLTIIFVLLGLAIMLRLRIDPRTVMTVQNQIPRIVICILLITFSYGIAGALIDLMWIGTYVGINTLTSVPAAQGITTGTGGSFAQAATNSVMQTPFAFFNQIMSQDKNDGIFEITQSVSVAIGVVVRDIVARFFDPNLNGECVTEWLPPKFDWSACAAQTFGNVLGFIATVVFYLIILITILIILFRVWFELLKAYVFVLFYVITAPIWIVFGLIPGRPLGFEKWLRGIFANIAVFPMVVGLFIAARIFLEVFKSDDPHLQFSPPLIGQPNIDAFGALLAFGVLLMSPTFLNMLRDALKVPSSKYTGAIMGTVGAGASVASAPAQRSWAAMTRRDQQGNPAGVLSVAGSKAVNKTLTNLAGKSWMPAKGMMNNAVQRRQNQAAGLGYSSDTELLHKNIEASKALGPTSYYGQQAAMGAQQLLAKENPNRQERKVIKEAHDAGLLKDSLSKKESEGGLNEMQRKNLSLALKTDLSDLKAKTGGDDQSHAAAGAQPERQAGVPGATDASDQNSHDNTVDVTTINAQTVNAQKVNDGSESTEKGHPPTLTDAPQRFSETLLKSTHDAIGSLHLEGAKANDKEAVERIMHKLEENKVEGTPEQHHAVVVEILKQNEKKGEEGPKDHK